MKSKSNLSIGKFFESAKGFLTVGFIAWVGAGCFRSGETNIERGVESSVMLKVEGDAADEQSSMLIIDNPSSFRNLKAISGVKENRIAYDSTVGEYQVHIKTVKGVYKFRLFYDPFTGERLESGRDELFAKIEKQELVRIEGVLKGCDTYDDALRLFGMPNRRFSLEGGVVECDFNSISKTAIVKLRFKDGVLIETAIQGKMIEDGKVRP